MMTDNYFKGDMVMRGHGLGSLFSSLFRRALPFIKTGAKYIGRKAAESGARVLDDVLEGNSPKVAFRNNAKRMGRELLIDAKKKMKGRGRSHNKSKIKKKAAKQKDVGCNSKKHSVKRKSRASIPNTPKRVRLTPSLDSLY